MNEHQSKMIKTRSGEAEFQLDAIAIELKNLKQNLVAQLTQEINQLQARKTRLQREVEQFELEQRQQVAQQRQMVNQLAPTLVNKLQEILQERLARSSEQQESNLAASSISDHNERADKLISSLDSTLRTAFDTLEQDLGSYQSSLSTQLNQMYNLEQQGEAILEALIQRLKAELTSETPLKIEPPPELRPAPKSAPEPTPSPPPQNPKSKIATEQVSKPKLQLGLILVLLSSLALSFYNVVISVVLNGASVFGQFQFEQILPTGFGNALLVLWLRMLVVVPLMLGLANILYPKTWQDIANVVDSRDRDLWLKVIGSGFCLFSSQVLIYLAFGSGLTPGEVITLFFIFPIVTLIFSWLWFGERPSIVRGVSSIMVFLGVLLISLSAGGGVSFSLWGLITAVSSGITFAFYVILTQVCAQKLHPVPFSLINFCTILLLSGLSFMIPTVRDSVNVPEGNWYALIVSGLILGGLTLISYLFNNIGISLIGATRSSIFGATGPVLTSLLAFLIIGSSLSIKSFLGMLIVTTGVAALSLERLWKK